MTDLKLCTSEFMISDSNGLGLRRSWFPRVVAEAFLGSTKDGEANRAPDPVTMIDGDLTWFNNSKDAQRVAVLVHRAPRSITTTNPNTVVIHDAWSFDVGKDPSAPVPTITQDSFGGKLQVDRADTPSEELKFGRFFFDGDDSQTYVDLGVVAPMTALHFRYRASIQTPGVWTSPEENARYEAAARWTRLIALASPEAS